ncbi:AUXIN RESPONSE FACTOR 4-RELATED, partial [Salix purpurea]
MFDSRYMGTITGISDLDPVRWPNSHWRSVKVGWDESTAGERQPRVSLWEIEPLTTFPMYPSAFPMRLKRPWPSGLPSFHGLKDGDFGINSPMMWLQGGVGDLGVQSLNFQSFGGAPWIQPRFDASMPALQPDVYQTLAAAALQEMRTVESSKLGSQSLSQFQQSQNVSNGPTALIQRQMLQQSNLQNALLQNFQENQASTQAQLLQQQLQHCNQYTDQQQQHQPQPQQVQQPKQLNELFA